MNLALQPGGSMASSRGPSRPMALDLTEGIAPLAGRRVAGRTLQGTTASLNAGTSDHRRVHPARESPTETDGARTPASLRRPFVLVSLFVTLALAALLGASGEAALTTADIVRFLRAGISERTILSELDSRGFAEPLDQERETTLRQAGATETLVVAIRRVATAAAGAAAAPTPGLASANKGSGGSVFTAGTRTVRLPVSVLDPNGEPVLGLSLADFRLSEDGKRQDLTQFTGDRRPLRLALALDLSGSMRRKIVQVEEALKHFVDLLEPADEVMVITFNGQVRIAQDFTANRDQLGEVLDGLEPDGSTALYDATYEAIKRVANGPAEAKAVVLVTDGVDTASRTAFDTLREYARRAGVPVYSIGIEGGEELRPSGPHVSAGPRGFGHGGGGGGSRGHARGRREGFDDKPLKELADDTGGRAYVVKGLDHYTPGVEGPSSGPLKMAVESIATTLRHRYLIGYEPPQGKPGWRTISVEVTHPTSARAVTRKGYVGS